MLSAPSASKGDAAKKSVKQKNPWLSRVFWEIIQLYGDYFVNRYKDPGRKQPGFNGIQRYQKSNRPEAEQTQWCRGHLAGRLEFWCHV